MSHRKDWAVIERYFEDHPYYATKHHLDSYNEWVSTTIPQVIRSQNPITQIKTNDRGIPFEMATYIGGRDGTKIYLEKPMHEGKILYPNEARLRDLDYAAEVRADIEMVYRYDWDDTTKTFRKEYPVVRFPASSQEPSISLFKIPVMTHSRLCVLQHQPPSILTEMGECPYDQGGYFILRGKEKVILSQERSVFNKLFVQPTPADKDGYTHRAQIQCLSEFGGEGQAPEDAIFPSTTVFQSAPLLGIVVTLPRTNPNLERVPIPVWHLFRALGVESDQDILHLIVDPTHPDYESIANLSAVRHSMVQGSTLFRQDDVYAHYASYYEYNSPWTMRHFITKKLFPHMGTRLLDKARYLGTLVNTILRVTHGLSPPTDKDSYANKRVFVSGLLLDDLFRDLYNKHREHIRSKMDQMYLKSPYRQDATTDNISKIINPSNQRLVFEPGILGPGLMRSVRGVEWMTSSGTPESKQGVSQDLSRLSYMAYLSYVRRVNNPFPRELKMTEPHFLHCTQYGMVCPMESPDGADIGLLKHFAVLVQISTHAPSAPIRQCLKDLGVEFQLARPSTMTPPQATRVYVNGTWVGWHAAPEALLTRFRLLRRNALVPIMTGVSWDPQEEQMFFRTDGGRCCRPLYIVDREATPPAVPWWETKSVEVLRKTPWKKLIQGDPLDYRYVPTKKSNAELARTASPMEYLDIDEIGTCLIAMTQEDILYRDQWNVCTHVEIHPSTMLSMYTNTIPLCNHNQAPRNVFSGQQGKQAIGVYATNFQNRIDTASYILHYPQRPLIDTHYAPYTRNTVLPNGTNLMVAIATYTGYNMEDSVILNANSVARGMYHITSYKSYLDQEEDSEAYTRTGQGTRTRFGNPHKMQESGGVRIECRGGIWYTDDGTEPRLDDDGMPMLHQYVGPDAVLLGKYQETIKITRESRGYESLMDEGTKEVTYRDQTVVGSTVRNGTVDKVYRYPDPETGLTKVKLRLRTTKTPEYGDKTASRHGQKGIVGMILPAEEMPFTRDGLVPDIIINPHAIPSRMTLGHLLETLLAKECCKRGVTMSATAFEHLDVPELVRGLRGEVDADPEHWGDEVMYNGRTGEQIQTRVFLGPTYYFRLKHMVKDKINARRQGPMTNVTRQPTHGRGKGGGLRIGEMETNALLAHGVGGFIKESMMERSDKTELMLDNAHGGDTVPWDPKTGEIHSEEVEDTSVVQVPYAWKLLRQELQAIALRMDVHTDATLRLPEAAKEAQVLAATCGVVRETDEEA